MAVSLITTVPRYVVASTDTFPDAAVIGAQVYEYDTGREYLAATTSGWTLRKETEFPGIITTVTHSIVAAATSSKTLLAASTSRMWAAIINDSTDDIYLNFGGAAVASSGFRLNPRTVLGDRIEMNLRDGNLFKGAISCITAVSSSTINILAVSGVST